MFQRTISMLRVKDARASEAFYRDKLGFKNSWEHDPGDGFPVFIEVSRDAVSFHLSEHEGDGPERIQVYVNVKDAQALYADLISKDVKIENPPEDVRPCGRIAQRSLDFQPLTQVAAVLSGRVDPGSVAQVLHRLRERGAAYAENVA